jgi:hypothetical protein
MIDEMQRLCIPQELLNCNIRNISFSVNWHNTFVWSRHVNREDFHSRMLSFYLDKEAFDKDLMLWSGVKHNSHKSGMHYIMSIELLKKKGKEAGVGPSLGSEPLKKESPTQSDSKEEEVMQPLECKKRTLSIFQPLP